MDSLLIYFQLLLDRLTRKPIQAHSPGSKKPSLSDLDEGRKG